jgi:hypothetical protein
MAHRPKLLLARAGCGPHLRRDRASARMGGRWLRRRAVGLRQRLSACKRHLGRHLGRRRRRLRGRSGRLRGPVRYGAPTAVPDRTRSTARAADILHGATRKLTAGRRMLRRPLGVLLAELLLVELVVGVLRIVRWVLGVLGVLGML